LSCDGRRSHRPSNCTVWYRDSDFVEGGAGSSLTALVRFVLGLLQQVRVVHLRVATGVVVVSHRKKAEAVAIRHVRQRESRQPKTTTHKPRRLRPRNVSRRRRRRRRRRRLRRRGRRRGRRRRGRRRRWRRRGERGVCGWRRRWWERRGRRRRWRRRRRRRRRRWRRAWRRRARARRRGGERGWQRRSENGPTMMHASTHNTVIDGPRGIAHQLRVRLSAQLVVQLVSFALLQAAADSLNPPPPFVHRSKTQTRTRGGVSHTVHAPVYG